MDQVKQGGIGMGFEAFLDGLCGRLDLPDTATFDDILAALDKVISAQNTRDYVELVRRERVSEVPDDS